LFQASRAPMPPPTCGSWPQKVVEQILQAIFLNNFL
jgi:hypothetical protein